jgi:hypothetical protein
MRSPSGNTAESAYAKDVMPGEPLYQYFSDGASRSTSTRRMTMGGRLSRSSAGVDAGGRDGGGSGSLGGGHDTVLQGGMTSL